MAEAINPDAKNREGEEMKKAFSIIIVLLVCFVYIGISYAGEKEELTWRVKYYQEKMSRMQTEYAITNEALKEAVGKLKAIETAEKAKVKADSEKKAKK